MHTGPHPAPRVISLLANAGNLKVVFDICESLFKILLSTTSSSCENGKNILNEKAQHIENFKADSLSHKSSGFSDHVAVGDNNRTKLPACHRGNVLTTIEKKYLF